MTLLSDDVDQLLQQGENERVEFKADAQDPHRLARDLAAFANSRGGVLIIGIDESRRGPLLRDVDERRAASIVDRAVPLIEPPVHVTGQEVKVGEVSLYAIEVPEQRGNPFIVDERVYVRRGATSVVATPEVLKGEIVRRDEPREQLLVQLDSFADALARQGELIERLERSSSWQRQLFWTLLGAVLGTVLGVVATILIS